MATFGERCRARRKDLGLTQAEVAKRAGLAQGTIGDIEQGTQHSTRKIDKLAQALETTPDHLRGSDATAPAPISIASLTGAEASLIEKFRRLSPGDQGRVEAFVQGMRASRRGPKRPPSSAPGSIRHISRGAG